MTIKGQMLFALMLLPILSACGGNGSAVAPMQTVAIRMASRIPPHVAKSASANLVTDSDSLRAWTLQGGFTLGKAGQIGPVDAELAGTGTATSADLYSAIITVMPARKYTFSVWADASRFTKGRPILMVTSPSRNAAYGPQFAFSGSAGRFSGTISIPNGVTRVRLDVSSAGGTIAKGQKFKVSRPMFSTNG